MLDFTNLSELQAFADSLPVAVFAIDLDHRVKIWNLACEKLTGISAADMIGRDRIWPAFYNVDRPVLANLVVEARLEQEWESLYPGKLQTNDPSDALVFEDFFPRLPSGGRWLSFSSVPWHGPCGKTIGAVQFLRDISYRKSVERERENSDRRLAELLADLEYRSNHDLLTGLPNRALLFDRLTQAVAAPDKSDDGGAVLFLDLDGFKFVNDTLGHQAGDDLLKMAAERLGGCLRDSDTMGRIGGDEFGILLPGMTDPAAVATVAQRLIDTLEEPFQLGQEEAMVTASIGIAMVPADAENAVAALKHADAAMYRAKERGKSQFVFFNGLIGAKLQERMQLKSGLKRAIERQEFEVHFQPKSDMDCAAVTGAEALLRWRHPQLGMVSPAKIIPLLEETGLISEVGEWVINEACRQHRSWRDAGLAALPIAVNLSARQVCLPDLPGRIGRILAAHELGPDCLELEITESLLMQNRDQAREVLTELGHMGIRLALDDFGTGYSSLSYLKVFPIDTIKVDRSFVEDLHADPDDLEIVRAIISMGHSLGRTIIAEGVEREEQRTILSFLGCDFMQGYLLSRPLPPEEFSAFLRSRATQSPVTPTGRVEACSASIE